MSNRQWAIGNKQWAMGKGILGQIKISIAYCQLPIAYCPLPIVITLGIFDLHQAMTMRLRLFCIFLLLSSQLHGQFQQEYIFSSLSSRNGLVSEAVTGVQQDEKGFIWISTLNGLQRFDARRFVTFRNVPGDTLSIPNDYVSQSLIDHRNRLWLRCDQTRIGYFNPVSEKFHETPIPGMSATVLKRANTRLQIDADGNVLLLFLNKGIYIYN